MPLSRGEHGPMAGRRPGIVRIHVIERGESRTEVGSRLSQSGHTGVNAIPSPNFRVHMLDAGLSCPQSGVEPTAHQVPDDSAMSRLSHGANESEKAG
jgi:hypothetical protein